MPNSCDWRSFKFHGVKAKDILRYFSIRRPPIDVVSIARGIGVSVNPTNTLWKGALLWEHETPSIWVRASDTPYDQRMTVSHEIGHLLLHDSQKMFRDSYGQAITLEEIEADKFSSELIMPANMIRAYASTLGGTSSTLAQHFEVPTETMRRRLCELYI